MTPQHVISQLLESDTKYPKNLDLLKKIIIAVYLGRFRINGLPPDNKISLGNYLFDEERMIFDFTHLSDSKREEFLNWLLGPHQHDKEHSYLNNVYVNEYRGFTAEVPLSLWGRLKSWLQNRNFEHWKITDLGLNLNYQLTGIEMCHGRQGILIGFNQYQVPPSGTKYKSPNDSQKNPMGNTKRVFITDKLVAQLAQLNIASLKFESICKGAHPYAIEVNDMNARHVEMRNYREMQKFVDLKPWYIRIFTWIIASFENEPKAAKSKRLDNKLKVLYESDDVRISQRSISNEIMVHEKKPDIKNLVLCGGGAKIFAHIGVWKALNEAGIRPTKFAGSSAGAIMSLLCYLGYNAHEVYELFKDFKQENLVLFDINLKGLADPGSLKTALDYVIAKRLKKIVTEYKIPYPEGVISFVTLDNIKRQCPGCGIGEELIITATNKKLRQTHYFSVSRTPNFEVSGAGTASACYPVLYRNTIINGVAYNDGGILSNFPTEAFSGANGTTLLESESGNDLGVLAVQFNNGTERNTIDRIKDRVYRENFFLNWIYSLLTGVSDPASAWEIDRRKLRHHAAQSIIIDAEVSASGFSVEEKTQYELIQNGYKTTKEFLDIRYSKKGDTLVNNELMYSTFDSLGDLLAFCCYRDNFKWFEVVHGLIEQSTLPNKAALIKQSADLRALYFSNPSKKTAIKPVEKNESSTKPPTFFGNGVSQLPVDNKAATYHNELLILHPTFTKLTPSLLRFDADRKILELARHSLRIHSPFKCLEYFLKITYPHHVILHITINLVKELKASSNNEEIAEPLGYSPKIRNAFIAVQGILSLSNIVSCQDFFGTWNLTCAESLRVLNLLSTNQLVAAKELLARFSRKEVPLQTFKNGAFYEEFAGNDQLGFGA